VRGNNQAATEGFLARRGWVVTSRFRPTGTHQYGAVDMAPRYPSGSLFDTGVPGYLHKTALLDAAAAQEYAEPGVSVYLENNHVHMHTESRLPSYMRRQSQPGVEIPNPEEPALRFTPWKMFLANSGKPTNNHLLKRKNAMTQEEIGEIELGEIELGDEFGDELGDEIAIGDVEGDAYEAGDEIGGPRLRKIGRFIKKHPYAVIGGAALGVGGGVLAARAISKRNRRIRQARAARLQSQVQAANAASDPANTWPFFIGDNMRFVTSPVSEAVNRMTRTQILNLLNRAAGDTPTPPIYKSATAAVGTATISVGTGDLPLVGGQTLAVYLFPFILVELAASVLNALPSSLMVATTLSVPTQYIGIQNMLAQGQLVVQPAVTTKRLAFGFVPFVTLNSAPQPVLGCLQTTGPSSLSIAISGLPDGCVMNVVLGGTTHPSVIMMRHWAEHGVLPMPPHQNVLQSTFLSTF